MKSNHLSESRMWQFMFNSIQLTEEEGDHISGWKCAECTETMRKVVAEERDTGASPPEPSN